ncbi:uncharacterized protein LOC106159689 [Lingula anatina]|uniref:Uncharacterized protein LOC106159689 n=1 Tax=Lingula anatina TaxID=7574 RepID=A0A1S3HZS9_LINAN|nr:uncharacterized protein LOC106159689 [Lingula anatina]|eukprot:XP_013391522.1 uncharacterized protein LOC106159689 [Lingula anatina]
MPQYCCVPECKSRQGGHNFPKDSGLRLKWRVAINRVCSKTKRLWNPGRYSVVCAKHFTPSDYRETLTGNYRCLKSTAVPTIFNFVEKANNADPSVTARAERAQKRSELLLENVPVPDIGNEEVIVTEPGEISDAVEAEEIVKAEEPVQAGVQCSILTDAGSKYSVQQFVDNPDAIMYYTGFENYEHFTFFLKVLGPAAYSLNYESKSLSVEDHLFLTLIKLRLAKDDKDLGFLFKVSSSTVSKIVNTWVVFMYYQLSEIDFWPDKQTVQEHMPTDFKAKFPKTRVILDATEIPIHKPDNVADQSATFSTYKNRNTLKAVVGCSPRGVCTYVSEAYGGSTSDRQIIERSSLLQDKTLFCPGDSIMADRGIMVQDLFAGRDVHVNTPSMLKGKSQLEPDTVIRDRRVASKRIHVERLIGLGKTYKILKRELHSKKVPLGGMIIKVCFLMSNFRRSIVSKYA